MKVPQCPFLTPSGHELDHAAAEAEKFVVAAMTAVMSRTPVWAGWR